MLPESLKSNTLSPIGVESTCRLFWMLFETLSEGGALLDRDGRVCAVNASLSTMIGIDAVVLRGEHPDFFKGISCESFDISCILRETRTVGRWDGELFVQMKNGRIIPVDVLIIFVSGKVENALSSDFFLVRITDVSERKSDKAWVRFHAHYDLLTRLPNRRLLMKRLEAALETAFCHKRQGCVLLLNLDRFKIINDTFGYAVGDELLRLVAQRLSSCVGIEGSLGRLGGDEFLIILPEMRTAKASTTLVKRIQADMQTPFFLGVSDQFCQVSIGIAIFPNDGLGAGDVIRNAGVAMRASRKEDAQHYAVYDPIMSEIVGTCSNLENDLRHASSRGELEILYQPKVHAASLLIQGAEALLRWQHPVHGLISPADFIPLAEETGLIISIGRWVLQCVCQQMSVWQATGVPIHSISVNVSPRQFQDKEFVYGIRFILEETGIDPASLDLEITESVMSGDMARAIATLRELKDLGVTLSMDDFGTGYSSLTWLKGFPIDTLKIDRTFVCDLDHDDKNAAIVNAIITLARSLGFSLVAEGIEKEVHAEFLHKMGCNVFQGFWISKPLSSTDFVKFVEQHAKKRVKALPL